MLRAIFGLALAAVSVVACAPDEACVNVPLDGDSGGVTCVENLVTNGSFDDRSDGWGRDRSVTTVQFTTENPVDDLSPSSVRVTNTVWSTSGEGHGLYQCVEVQPAMTHLLEADVFMTSAEPETARTRISAAFYGEANCTGDRLDTMGASSVNHRDQWSLLTDERLAPDLAVSATIAIEVYKEGRTDDVTAQFDEIVFAALP